MSDCSAVDADAEKQSIACLPGARLHNLPLFAEQTEKNECFPSSSSSRRISLSVSARASAFEILWAREISQHEPSSVLSNGFGNFEISTLTVSGDDPAKLAQTAMLRINALGKFHL